MDFKDSIEKTKPKLPEKISKILVDSAVKSVFDFAIDEILEVLEMNNSKKDISDALDYLILKYENFSSSIICQGCFERDFNKLLLRAELEGSKKVIIEQEGESFLHQKFIASKLIHIIEPSHSLVYSTFIRVLNHSSDKKSSIKIFEREFYVTKLKFNLFSLIENGESILILSFKK